jgi:hypothetical protein
LGKGTARLQQASGAAVSSVLKIMVDQHTPASTKLRAADLVLTHGAKAIEIEDIEARVAELERIAEESKNESVGGTYVTYSLRKGRCNLQNAWRRRPGRITLMAGNANVLVFAAKGTYVGQ